MKAVIFGIVLFFMCGCLQHDTVTGILQYEVIEIKVSMKDVCDSGYVLDLNPLPLGLEIWEYKNSKDLGMQHFNLTDTCSRNEQITLICLETDFTMIEWYYIIRYMQLQ